MAIEKIALAEQDAADLMPGEAADRPIGLTRRVFGILIGTGALGTAAGWGIVSAAGGTEEVPTSFGTVRIAAAERQARMVGAVGGHASSAAHGAAPPGASAQPFNHTWGEHLAVKLEVRNTSERNVLFAPGQLRLLVAKTTTVTNRGADVAKILLTAGSHRSVWVSFLVPSGVAGLAAQFTDPWGGPAPLALALPRISLRPGSLEDNHG